MGKRRMFQLQFMRNALDQKIAKGNASQPCLAIGNGIEDSCAGKIL